MDGTNIKVDKEKFFLEVADLEEKVYIAKKMKILPDTFTSNVESWIRNVNEKYAQKTTIDWSDIQFLRKTKKAFFEVMIG